QVLESSGPTLQDLDISDCYKLTDTSLKSVGINCRALVALSLGMCPNFTDDAVR
ncbi:unnamed protein product, partial [Discosporangium mesarthrocarpum]